MSDYCQHCGCEEHDGDCDPEAVAEINRIRERGKDNIYVHYETGLSLLGSKKAKAV
jgi:hypothetical protein